MLQSANSFELASANENLLSFQSWRVPFLKGNANLNLLEVRRSASYKQNKNGGYYKSECLFFEQRLTTLWQINIPLTSVNTR